MLNIHTRILVHLAQNQHTFNNGRSSVEKRRGSNNSPPRMASSQSGDENLDGMEHDSSDILAAEPRRKGGLMRSSDVSSTLARFAHSSL